MGQPRRSPTSEPDPSSSAPLGPWPLLGPLPRTPENLPWGRSLPSIRTGATPPRTLTPPRLRSPITRPAAACEQDAPVATPSRPPRPSPPPGPAATRAAPGPRPHDTGPRRRSAPGSWAAPRAPGRPKAQARAPPHVAPVPPPGPPGGQGETAMDASRGHPATVPRGGAGGRRKHCAPHPRPR